MSEAYDGGPAFPLSIHPDSHDGKGIPTGLSVRDWFAGQIAAALAVGCSGMLQGEFAAYAKGPHNGAIANRAYALADCLIRERTAKAEGKAP